jgi:protein gp37
MSKTKIAWTDRVWNPVTGCTKISEGCKNCYAKTVHDMRHKAYKQGKRVPEQYAVPFENPMIHSDRLMLPNWKTPQKVFVNSMSDLFHEDVPDQFILQIIRQIRDMNLLDDHVFQVLTKRPERMHELLPRIRYTNGIFFLVASQEDVPMDYPMYGWKWNDAPLESLWLGVTAENQKAADERIPLLLDTPAAIRWVSVEPMLEEVELTFQIWGEGYSANRLDWVVVGCESGKNRRPCKLEWIESIVEQCKDANVAVFVKQIELNGKVFKAVKKFPQHLQIQEFPK